MDRPLELPDPPPCSGSVILRGFTPADVEMVRELATDADVAQAGTLPSHADVAQAYIERQRGRPASGRGDPCAWRWAPPALRWARQGSEGVDRRLQRRASRLRRGLSGTAMPGMR